MFILTFTFIFLFSVSWFPWNVVVVRQAEFAVVAPGVVIAVAFAVDHLGDIFVLLLFRQTTFSMSVARAGSSDCHVVDGIIVFFLRNDQKSALKSPLSSGREGGGELTLISRRLVSKFSSPIVKSFRHSYSKVGGLQQVLDLSRVRRKSGAVEVNVRR